MKYVLVTPARDEEAFISKKRIQSLHFDVIGSLDADISFEPDYFAFLLNKFREFPDLGVAGTAMREAHLTP
jgi:hypothetical protein